MHQQTSLLTVLFVTALIIVSAVMGVASASDSDCSASDAALTSATELYCGSMVGWTTSWCPSTEAITNKAKKDWPSQSIYFVEILQLLQRVPATSCLMTPVANFTVEWLNTYQTNISLPGSLVQTWASPTGQPNYFEMPRPAGARIESPWTLGMKCYAFSYLAEIGQPAALAPSLAAAGHSIDLLIQQYNSSSALGLTLCEEVMANCFLNESYDPRRKGTCPLSVDDFKLGFDWMGLEHKKIPYPF